MKVSYWIESSTSESFGPGMQLIALTFNWSQYLTEFSILLLNSSFLLGFYAKFIIPVDSSNTSTLIKTCFSPKSLIKSFNSFKSIP